MEEILTLIDNSISLLSVKSDLIAVSQTKWHNLTRKSQKKAVFDNIED